MQETWVMGSIPGSGRSPGGGNGKPLQYSFFLFFNFTILYWFCHISTWIHHKYTCVPHPEPSSLLPPHNHPSGSSQCTRPKHPVSCIEPGLATRFIYDIIHVSMPFSQIIPTSLSPTESKRLSGESHAQRSLEGYSPWVCKESHMTKVTKHRIPH